jgi:hypothetical protein
MDHLFKPDIFSTKLPEWTRGSMNSFSGLNTLLNYLPAGFNSEQPLIEYSGGLEINSSNFKLSVNGESLLLKRWSKSAEKNQVESVLRTMDWLANSEIPVPKPIKFGDDSFLLQHDGYFWSCYPFVDGEYFSGKGSQISSVALITAKLTNALSKLPPELIPDKGPLHLTDEDDRIIIEIEGLRSKWEVFFGTEYTKNLEDSWELLTNNWHRIRKMRVNPGPELAVHFDLHPHNMIFNDSQASAVLDFESCKVMPVGYALAFAGLKQCRQTIAFHGDTSLARETGRIYLNILSAELERYKPLTNNFCDLALAEIIRRICIIFRLNISGNKEWNKVLPVQLAHLYEAKALFENN